MTDIPNALALAALSLSFLFVQRAFADGPPGGPPSPPPEATQACDGKAENASCTFEGRGHTVEGTCRAAPGNAPLACFPAHPPGPPPEAVTACSGKSENESCSVQLGQETLDGTCERGPEGTGPLACRPTRPPPR